MSAETHIFDREREVEPTESKTTGRGYEIEHVVGVDGKIDPIDVFIHLPGTDLMFEAVYIDGLGISIGVYRSKTVSQEVIC